jgi:2-keto-4-pentenoate hydratase/2-oxohepta-3-ene-1,7-dioic acid hydratase in catechol pathway
MRLVSWRGGFGRVEGDAVVPMGADVVDYLTTGDHDDGQPVPNIELTPTGPVPRPEKIVCIGLNYADHAAETGGEVPGAPVLFAKFPNSLIGPGEAIEVPRAAAAKVDYEAELAAVIGREASEVSEDEALAHVAGYMCANDISARDLQFASSQWTHGKAIDTFLPTGPWLVTADEIGDPQKLAIGCRVGDEVVQDSNTSNMIFTVAQLVSFISQTMTLVPGDVICTGTPAGVGFVREPSRYLHPGEEVTVSIEGIGDLTNPVRRR